MPREELLWDSVVRRGELLPEGELVSAQVVQGWVSLSAHPPDGPVRLDAPLVQKYSLRELVRAQRRAAVG